MWTSLPLDIRDAIAAHVFGSEDVVVGERLQNLLSLVDLSPSFVRHAAALKQRSHVSARAHEKAKRVAAERAARESAALREEKRVDFRYFAICFGAGQVAWAVLVIGATPPTSCPVLASRSRPPSALLFGGSRRQHEVTIYKYMSPR